MHCKTTFLTSEKSHFSNLLQMPAFEIVFLHFPECFEHVQSQIKLQCCFVSKSSSGCFTPMCMHLVVTGPEKTVFNLPLQIKFEFKDFFLCATHSNNTIRKECFALRTVQGSSWERILAFWTVFQSFFRFRFNWLPNKKLSTRYFKSQFLTKQLLMYDHYLTICSTFFLYFISMSCRYSGLMSIVAKLYAEACSPAL